MALIQEPGGLRGDGGADPTAAVLAHGMSFALAHAAALAHALDEHHDSLDACSAHAASAAGELRERYALATLLDEQRLALWCGEPVDASRRDGAYALFSIVTAAVAASADADIARVFSRRIGLLDSTAVLDEDAALQRRIEEVYGAVLAVRGRPPGPRDDVLAAIAASAAH